MEKKTLNLIVLTIIAMAFMPLALATENETEYNPSTDYVAPYQVNQGNFFPWGYDFLTLGVIFIILLLIYFLVLPEDTRRLLNRFLTKFGIYIVLFVIWLVFRKRWGKIYEVPGRWPAMHYWVTFLVVLILVIYWLVTLFLYKQRYLTYHAIANNRSGSCAYYFHKGDYTILLIGTSGRTDEKIVIPNPVPQEIWVIPRCAWRKIGGQMLLESQIVRKDFIDMPPEVREAIEEHPLASVRKNKIYYGLWSQKTRASDPKYNEIEQKLTEAYARINELQDMLKAKLKNVKGFISDTFAMQEKIRGKDWKTRAVTKEYEE